MKALDLSNQAVSVPAGKRFFFRFKKENENIVLNKCRPLPQI